MAGNSGLHFKVRTGQLKGRAVYLTSIKQRQIAARTMGAAAWEAPLAALRSTVMQALESGAVKQETLVDSAPGGAQKGGAFAGTESQQISQKQGFEAAKQLTAVTKQLQNATDPDVKKKLASRAFELQGIIQSAQHDERMAQLAPTQKALRLAAVTYLRDQAQKSVNDWQAEMTKLQNMTPSGKMTAAKIASELSAAKYARDQMLGMLDGWSGDVVRLSEPAIPGKALFTGPTNEELINDLPLPLAVRSKLLSQADKGSLPGMPKTTKAPPISAVGMNGAKTNISGFFGKGGANDFNLYREGAGLEMNLSAWNKALVDAFAQQFGATATRIVSKNKVAGSKTARVQFNFPGGADSIPTAEAMVSWLKQQQ